MHKNFSEYKAVAENMQLWLNSNDLMLVNLANAYLEEPTKIYENDFMNLLTFLAVASISCSELEMSDLAKKFEWRINKICCGLANLGYSSKSYMYYTTMTKRPCILKRIIMKVCNQTEYLTRESTRLKTGRRVDSMIKKLTGVK